MPKEQEAEPKPCMRQRAMDVLGAIARPLTNLTFFGSRNVPTNEQQQQSIATDGFSRGVTPIDEDGNAEPTPMDVELGRASTSSSVRGTTPRLTLQPSCAHICNKRAP